MIYELPLPRVGQTEWLESHRQGSVHEPDVWTASKRNPSGVVVCEVEFHNAGITRGQKARQQFSCAVSVQAPPGWEIVADCDRPLPTEWYPMHAAMRRYAMFPASTPSLLREATLESAMPYDTIRWPRGRAAYGPCNIPLPKLSPQQMAAGATKVLQWKQKLRTILAGGGVGPIEDGEDGIFIRQDGWAPWGIKDRGAPAGSGIRFFTGWEGAPDSPAYSWAKACCNHERWWHAYDRATGQVVNAEFYGDPGPKYQAGTGDPNNGWLPEFIGVAQSPDPLPLPYDASHSIRGFRDLIFLSEATDSPGVKRMLNSVAAQLRLQFSDKGPHPTPNYTPPSLRTWLDWARNAPHNGHYGQDTGRMIGWPALVIAQSIKRGGATANVAWAKMMSEFTETVVMPSGIISRCAEQNPASVWYNAQHDTFHSFEVPIYWFGAVGCATQSGRQIPHPTRFAECLYEEAPKYPYYSTFGPPQYGFSAKRGGAPYPTVTAGKDNIGDTSNALAGCALAAHLNPHERKRWIDAARKMETFADLNNSAGIVAQEQLL